MLIDEKQWENHLAILIGVHLKLCRSLKDLSNYDTIWQWDFAKNNSLDSGTLFSAALHTLYLIVTEKKDWKMRLFPLESG